MEEAERIAREEHGSIKLAVISGELQSLPMKQCLIGQEQGWAQGITIENWDMSWMARTCQSRCYDGIPPS
jgi:hypothetical protein